MKDVPVFFIDGISSVSVHNEVVRAYAFIIEDGNKQAVNSLQLVFSSKVLTQIQQSLSKAK